MVNNVEQMEYWVSPPLWHGLLNPRPMDELYPCGVAFLLPSPSVQPNWEVAHLAVVSFNKTINEMYFRCNSTVKQHIQFVLVPQNVWGDHCPVS